VTTSKRTFKASAENLEDLLRDGFRAMSKRLRAQFDEERAANQHNMESGVPLEDFFRQEFGSVFEEPYGVDAGKVVDHAYDTCGDCDFVLFDRRLAPLLKRPAAAGSRRKLFAFETTYGIIEVKQTLTLGAVKDGQLKSEPAGTLWDACSKIFAYKQLHRVEPAPLRWGINYPIGLLFFYNCELDLTSNDERDALLAEITAINQAVSPDERVNGVYVLDRFSVNWTFTTDPSSTTFITLQHPIETPGRPVWLTYFDSGLDTLYRMFSQLWSTLARTQLGPPDLLNEYGGTKHLTGRRVRSLAASTAASLELAALDQTTKK
jgi:hypothetical protein